MKTNVQIDEQILNDSQKRANKFKKWIKKLGVIGFLFFLIKGLIWLAIFFGIGKLIQ